MKNLLVVESGNDKFFLEALINHMNINTLEISNGFICNINEYDCLGGLSESSLTKALNAVKLKAKKDEISKIGIIIDLDEKTVKERLTLVNTCIKHSFGVDDVLNNVSELSQVSIDDKQNVDIATYFTNVAGRGELETVQKTIKSEPSTYADCLQSWQECLKKHGINKGTGLKVKDFDKFWVSVYIRYDTCSKEDQKQANRKCNNEAAMKKNIWDFNHECLNEIKSFLKLFSTLSDSNPDLCQPIRD